jgi:hypothetical protein
MHSLQMMGPNLHAETLEVLLQPGDFAIHAFSFAQRLTSKAVTDVYQTITKQDGGRASRGDEHNRVSGTQQATDKRRWSVSRKWPS